MPAGRTRGPEPLESANGDAGHAAVLLAGQVDRGAAHSAADIEHVFAAVNARCTGQCLREMLPGLRRRFVGLPQTVVQVPSPKKPIERRYEVIMVANYPLGNTGTFDHDAAPCCWTRLFARMPARTPYCGGATATGGGISQSFRMYASP